MLAEKRAVRNPGRYLRRAIAYGEVSESPPPTFGGGLGRGLLGIGRFTS